MEQGVFVIAFQSPEPSHWKQNTLAIYPWGKLISASWTPVNPRNKEASLPLADKKLGFAVKWKSATFANLFCAKVTCGKRSAVKKEFVIGNPVRRQYGKKIITLVLLVLYCQYSIMNDAWSLTVQMIRATLHSFGTLTFPASHASTTKTKAVQ